MIYKLITNLGAVKREIKRATTDNTIKNNSLNVALSDDQRATKQILINNKISNLQADEDLRLKQLFLKQEQQNGLIFLVTSIILSIISAFMSICGLNNTRHIAECLQDLQSVIITVLFVSFAIVNLIISYNAPYNAKNYYLIQSKLCLLQVIFTLTSIVSNMIFLRLQHINIILASVLAILLDMFSIYLSNLANAKRFKNKSVPDNTGADTDIFTMLQYIVTYKFKKQIQDRYNTLLQLDISKTHTDALQNTIQANTIQTIHTDVKDVVQANTEHTQDIQDTSIVADVKDTQKLIIDNTVKTTPIEHKQSTFRHTSNSKISKEMLYKMIQDLDANTELTPKLFSMQGNNNYYNWIKTFDNVKKIDNTYVRV